MENSTEQFTISKAREQETTAIGEVLLQSWLETYLNPVLGIDELWIRDQFVPDGKSYDRHRNNIIASLQPGANQLYLTVKDATGKIKGFLQVTRGDNHVTFDAIYLTKDTQGTGVAGRLMAEALKFAGHLPMQVEVADYNAKAIHFYQKYGFVVNEGTTRLHRGKIPIMTMTRLADKERNEV